MDPVDILLGIMDRINIVIPLGSLCDMAKKDPQGALTPRGSGAEEVAHRSSDG